MSGPPHDRGRPGEEAASNVVLTDSHILSRCGDTSPDHCCQSLGMAERKLLARLGLTCSTARCARDVARLEGWLV